MKKKPSKPVDSRSLIPEKIGVPECCTVAKLDVSSPKSERPGHVVRQVFSGRIDGNLARRVKLDAGTYWDTALTGFGLRVRETGGRSWIVKYAVRGAPKWVTLGRVGEVDAPVARERAKRLLADAALDGLPQKPKTRTAPLFRDYVAEFWADYAHHWKPITQKTNRSYINRRLVPEFGDLALDEIASTDVLRWRDGMAEQGGAFNRAVPVLAVMMIYAERLGYRRKGSNPCKGISRYKRQLPDRYLCATEYRRLARALDAFEAEEPTVVAALRLLIFTGARSGEIAGLKWAYVQPPRLMLPDSKTGPKIIYLNSPAMAVLDALPRDELDKFVFPDRNGSHRPARLTHAWDRIRRRATLPDVRIHDLRHSFASVAIADNISLHIIGKLLGHALPETTARYAHLADDVIADAADRVCGGLAAALGVGA